MPLATHRLRTLLLVAVAAAVVVAVAVAVWPRAEDAGANAGTPTMQFQLSGNPSISCDAPSAPTKCSVPLGETFNLDVAVTAFPEDPDGPPTGPCPGAPGCDFEQGYVYMQANMDWTATALTYKPQPNVVEVPWPDRYGALTAPTLISPTGREYGDISQGAGTVASTFKGVVVRLQFTCSSDASANLVHLLPRDVSGNAQGSELVDANESFFPTSDSLIITCGLPPTATPCAGACPTATSTSTPTTPTVPPTPTPCPPDVCARMSLSAAGSGVQCDHPAEPTKCIVPTNGTFNVEVAVIAFPPDPDGSGPLSGGYVAIATDLDWTGTSLVYKPQPNAIEVPWPDRSGIVTTSVPAPYDDPDPTRFKHGDISAGSGYFVSTFVGVILRLQFSCGALDSSNLVSLLPWVPLTNPEGASLADGSVFATIFPTSDTLTINCVAPPTPTPTATPNPIPRMQKLPVLQNLWLTRQGTKIPPIRCLDSTDVATLTESISVPVSGIDPKDPSQPRQVGGFAFQVTYDPLKVCVDLAPGPAWTAHPAQICTVEDSVSAPTLQGIARMNCVTLGKATLVDTNTAAGRVLATIAVRPQPGAYSQMRASQDNGQVVQLNNEACKLTDLQGHAIEVFSCEDADVTVRYLEGDVEPDCAVNTIDTQAIAFRWGASSGSLIYNSRFDVSGGGGISVNDLQFVYGRFGSTCAVPWPAQVPVKAK